MNIYAGLLFNQGYVSDPALARSLARTPRSTPGDGAGPQEPAPVPVPRRRVWAVLLPALRRSPPSAVAGPPGLTAPTASPAPR